MISVERLRQRWIERVEDIRWYLGHNDIATTRDYILNNQRKQKTTKIIVNALSEMNGIDVLKVTQID